MLVKGMSIMLDINLNLYKSFYAVAKSKSYSDASNKMNISVTAISKNIKQLEDQLDTQLFYRESKGVRLTESGEQLFEYVDKSFTMLGIGEKLLIQKNDLSTGEIVVGCPSHIATFYLMDFIKKVKIDYPNLKIKIIAGANAKELIELLENHKIDFIIDSTQIDIPYTNIEKEEIKTIQNIFISKVPLKIKDIKELENLKYILPFEYTSTAKKLRACLNQYNISIEDNMEIDITELRRNAVKSGIGIGYVMKDAVENELKNNDIYEVELPIKLPTSKLNLIYIKGQLTKADKKFIKNYLKKD